MKDQNVINDMSFSQNSLSLRELYTLLDCRNISHENKPFISNVKAIISGSHVELYIQDRGILIGSQSYKVPKRGSANKERKKINKKKSATRAKNNLRRKLNANFNNRSKFLTLTFNDYQDFDINSIDECNKKFDLFIKRLRYRYGFFKYARGIEFQQRGAVHYHLVADFDYIPKEILEDIWGHGFIWINDVTYVDNIGIYISKYFLKQASDSRFQDKKSYTFSANCKSSEVLRGKPAEKILNKLIDYKPKYSNQYRSEYVGMITYLEYDTKKLLVNHLPNDNK